MRIRKAAGAVATREGFWGGAGGLHRAVTLRAVRPFLAAVGSLDVNVTRERLPSCCSHTLNQRDTCLQSDRHTSHSSGTGSRKPGTQPVWDIYRYGTGIWPFFD